MKLDKRQYQVDAGLFNYYYGSYYSPLILYGTSDLGGANMLRGRNDGVIDETTGKIDKTWGLPTNDDFRQLFGMCAFSQFRGSDLDGNHCLNQIDVRTALSELGYQKNKDVASPLAIDIYSPTGDGSYRTAWFEDFNTNQHGFNMMPGGNKFAGEDMAIVSIKGIEEKWPVYLGDINQLYHTSIYATEEGGVTIHDYIKFDGRNSGSRYFNIRYCRRRTPEELGYELYYNNDVKNPSIIELKWNDKNIPAGYERLKNGYLRGFYIQYIREPMNEKVPKPAKYTVKQLVQFSKCVEEEGLMQRSGKTLENNEVAEDCGCDNKQTDKGSIKLYPNPAKNILYIEPNIKDEIISIKFYNSQSMQVKSVDSLNANHLDISNLPAGTYIIRINTSNQDVYTYRIIKE